MPIEVYMNFDIYKNKFSSDFIKNKKRVLMDKYVLFNKYEFPISIERKTLNKNSVIRLQCEFTKKKKNKINFDV